MSLSFPANPQLNATYTSGDTTWIWYGSSWQVAPLNNITVSSLTVSGHSTLEGVTSTGATGTDKLVYSNSPTFTGTVSGITAEMVGLGDVTNESKAVMFNNPVFTGTVTGLNITTDSLGLENVTNESKATMFNNPTFTGTVSGLPAVTASSVGLENVTNESKATMFTSPAFTGTATASALSLSGILLAQQSTEVLNTKTGATGVVAHDLSTGAIWSHSSISANFTANFTNVPTTSNRTIICTLILNQGTTARLPSAVQINGTAQTIKWLNWEEPAANASKVDVVSFSLIRAGSTWQVIGSLSSFG